jgi:hypothetical protein
VVRDGITSLTVTRPATSEEAQQAVAEWNARCVTRQVDDHRKHGQRSDRISPHQPNSAKAPTPRSSASDRYEQNPRLF